MKKNSDQIKNPISLKNEEFKALELYDNNISHNNEGENESFDSDENAKESMNDSENDSEYKK